MAGQVAMSATLVVILTSAAPGTESADCTTQPVVRVARTRRREPCAREFLENRSTIAILNRSREEYEPDILFYPLSR